MKMFKLFFILVTLHSFLWAVDDNYYPRLNWFQYGIHKTNPLPVIPFREPVRFTFFEYRGSAAVYGVNGLKWWQYDDQFLTFDSTETSLSKADRFFNRSIITVDLNIIRYNWLRLLIDQNYVDYMTGVGARAMSTLIPIGLNSGWQNEQVNGAFYNYKPEWYEAYVSHSFYYQPLKWLLLEAQYSTGYGEGTLYKNSAGTTAIPIRGFSYRYDIAGDILLEGKDGWTLMEIGAHIFQMNSYYKVDDPHEITPITEFNPSTFGLGISASLILGARQTKGNEALSLLREKRYQEARQNFATYKRQFPKTVRTPLANSFIAYCDSMIFIEYYWKGNVALQEYKIKEALNYYDIAVRSQNFELRRKAIQKRSFIAELFLYEAMQYIQAGDYTRAETVIAEALKLSPFLEVHLGPILAQLNLLKAEMLIEYSIFDRASQYLEIAESQDPELRPTIQILRQEIASGYVADLNRAIGEDDIKTARMALNKAIQSDRRIQAVAGEYVSQMNEKIAFLKEQESAESVEKNFSQLWQEHLESFRSAEAQRVISIGMILPKVKEILGNPTKEKQYGNTAPIYILWIYDYADKSLYLYFHDYVLMEIEEIRH